MKCAFLTLVTLVVLPLCVLADSDEKNKTTPPDSLHIENTVVVTATLNEAELKTVGSAISVITREEIERQHFRTVEDALAAVPGVQVMRTGTSGHSATLLIRGARSEHTLVMLDGIELNDPMSPSRGFDFGSLTLDNVERIEVIRGPQSTLYGSDAMGGVVNIVTRTGEGKPSFALGLEAGRYGTWTVKGRTSGSAKDFHFALAASRSATDGFSAAAVKYGNTEPDGGRNLSLDGKLQYDFRSNLTASVSFHHTQARLDLDNSGGAFGDDPNYTQNLQLSAVRGELRYSSPSGRWQHTAAVAWSGTERDYRNDTDPQHLSDSSTALYRGGCQQLEWRTQFVPNAQHILTAGYEFQQESGRSDYHSLNAWGPYDAVFPRRSADNHAVFVQDQYEAGGMFFLTGGMRIDHHERFGSAVNFRLAPALVFEATDTRLHASMGTGLKAPSLYQLYAPATSFGPMGNINLYPEKSWTVDGGVDQYFLKRTLWLSLTGYYNRFRNLIDFVNGFQNVGRAETSGLEFSGRWSPNGYLSATAAYTFTHSLNQDTEEPLLRRPRHTASLGLDFRPEPRVLLSGQIIGKGERWDMNYSVYPAERVRLNGYPVVNALLSVRPRPRLEFYCRVENLFDRVIEDIYGYGYTRRAAYGGVVVNIH